MISRQIATHFYWWSSWRLESACQHVTRNALVVQIEQIVSPARLGVLRQIPECSRAHFIRRSLSYLGVELLSVFLAAERLVQRIEQVTGQYLLAYLYDSPPHLVMRRV